MVKAREQGRRKAYMSSISNGFPLVFNYTDSSCEKNWIGEGSNMVGLFARKIPEFKVTSKYAWNLWAWWTFVVFYCILKEGIVGECVGYG